MPTLEKLQERLDQLRVARWQGASEVEFQGGSRVRYLDEQQLASAIANLERHIASLTGEVPVTTIRVAATK